jgi:DNA-binding winged helix-turn-helix (wHTH) protein/tetratricopeptide (TPR) repeat protein
VTGNVTSALYEFAEGRLDLVRRELYVRGQLADLQPLAFDLLAYFIVNVGRVIDKDELLTKVWGNSVGSDAMVARAVMKVRRAIGDDGQEPRMLKTVHRVGYRLDVTVRALASAPEVLPQVQVQAETLERAPRAPVVLPCRNLTGEASFDWVEHGLPGLVQQFAGSSAKLMLPPADWSAAGQAADDPLASACEALGALEAVRLELHRDGGQLRLDVLRGHDSAHAQQFAVEGASVADLARAVERAITAGTQVATSSSADQAFWEEQLAQALDLERRGAPERALAVMDECVQRLPASAQLWLAHAAMLRRMGRRDEAGKRAREALAITPAPASDGLRARALYEMAAQAWHDMKPDESARLAEDAIAAARQDPAAAGVVPDILSFYASISRERDAPVVGIRLAERAITAAVAIGSRAKESHARVVSWFCAAPCRSNSSGRGCPQTGS